MTFRTRSGLPIYRNGILAVFLWTGLCTVAIYVIETDPKINGPFPDMKAALPAALKAPLQTSQKAVKPPEPQSQMTPKGNETKKTGITELADNTTAARTFVINIVIFLLLLVFFAAIIWELRRASIVIEQIEVPKDMAEKGYTPQVVAQRIAAEIGTLQRMARIQGRRLEDAFELSTAQVDFTVPTAGVSYRGIIRYARQLFSRAEQRIRGEIVRVPNLMSVPTADTIRLNLRTSDNQEIPPDSCVGFETDLPQLLKKAAFEIAMLVDPYLIATYWFYTEQYKKQFQNTFDVVSRCITRTAVTGHHRAYLVWGNALLLQERFNEAEEKYRTAASLAPRFAPIYTSWGNLLRSKQRIDEAGTMYHKAISIDPREAAPWSNLGNVGNDRRLHCAAITYFRHALRLNPRLVAALSGWGYALWRLGRHDEAEEKFKRAIALDPQFGWSYFNWARLLLSQKRYDEAVAISSSAVQQPSIAQQPAITAHAYAVCGDILTEAGRFTEAEAMYQRSVAADPGAGNGLAGFAYLLVRQHRFEEALRKSNEALTVNPYHLGASNGRIEALRLLRRYDEAIEECKALVAGHPYQASAYIKWGQSLRSLHKPLEAISYFKRGIAIDHTDSWAWESWGSALMDMHQYEKAIAKYRQAAEINPWNANAYVGWGNALASLGRIDDGVAKCQHAIEIDHRNEFAYRSWARLLLRQHRHHEAIEKARIAAEHADNPAEAYATWGDILVEIGELSEAEAMYQRSVDADSSAGNGVVGFAYVLRRQRRYQDAIRKSEEAVTINPYHPGARTGWIEALRLSGCYNAAIEKCKALIANDPYQANAYVRWGQSLRSLHKPREAINYFKCAILIDRRNSLAMESWGSALIDIHQYKKALAKYRQAAEIDPWNANAHVGWGNAHASLGRLEEAVVHYRHALEIYDRNSWAWRRLSDTLIDLGRENEGLSEIRRAAKNSPDDSAILRETGHVLRRLGLPEAADFYHTATNIDPYDADALTGWALTQWNSRGPKDALVLLKRALKAEPSNNWVRRNIGTLLYDMDRPKTAFRWYAYIHRRSPEDIGIMVDWAQVLFRHAYDKQQLTAEERKERYTKAENKIRQAIEIDPMNTWALRTWGNMLLELHNPKDALEQFDHAVRIDPCDWASWAGRGDALRQLKRFTKAISAYKQAIAFRPQEPRLLRNLEDSLHH